MPNGHVKVSKLLVKYKFGKQNLTQSFFKYPSS